MLGLDLHFHSCFLKLQCRRTKTLIRNRTARIIIKTQNSRWHKLTACNIWVLSPAVLFSSLARPGQSIKANSDWTGSTSNHVMWNETNPQKDYIFCPASTLQLRLLHTSDLPIDEIGFRIICQEDNAICWHVGRCLAMWDASQTVVWIVMDGGDF